MKGFYFYKGRLALEAPIGLSNIRAAQSFCDKGFSKGADQASSAGHQSGFCRSLDGF